MDCGIALKNLPVPDGTRSAAQFGLGSARETVQTTLPTPSPSPRPSATPELCSDARAFVVNEIGGLSSLKMDGDCDVSFTAAQMFGCNTYQFTNTTDYSAGPPPFFTWKVMSEEGSIVYQENSTNLMYEFKEPGNYSVYLSAYGMACGDDVEDSQTYFVTIPPLNPDFTWKQKECEPLTLGFTNQTGRAGLSYEWEIWDSKVYKYTVENPTHTFTGFGERKVCLKATSPDGCQQTACKTVKVSEDLQPDFDWEYCLRNDKDKPTVTFINKSTGGVCPVTYKWEFGDTFSSTQKDPVHEYTGKGPYTVKLTMTDSAKPANKATKEHVFNLKVCTGDFTTRVCPDGDVIFRTDVAAEYPHWEFPGGDDYFFLFDRKNRERRVRYTDAGRYFVNMTYKDENHCKCKVTKVISIKKVECCDRNDKDKIRRHDFSYRGDQYRMQGKLVIRNILGLHYVKVKTVLKKKNKLGIYVRAKAANIRATWAGKLYTDGKECCCENESWIDANLPFRSNAAKAKGTYWVGSTWLGEKFRARKNSVTSTHYVQVDKGHIPETFTLTVGDECDRCRKRP